MMIYLCVESTRYQFLDSELCEVEKRVSAKRPSMTAFAMLHQALGPCPLFSPLHFREKQRRIIRIEEIAWLSIVLNWSLIEP
jgi:hypothetical protein